MKNILITCMIFVVVAFCATGAQAALFQTVNVNATVPAVTNAVTLSISKVVGTVWTKNQTAIAFGTLVLDPINHIFLPPMYYAVDVGVNDNSGNNWTVTHTRTSLAKGTDNLNDKVNVAFSLETDPLGVTPGTELQKVSFGDSNNIAYTRNDLTGGWLRIYYGVGTGDPAHPDAFGVTPIGMDTPSGTYAGSVTLTLTP